MRIAFITQGMEHTWCLVELTVGVPPVEGISPSVNPREHGAD